MPALPGSPAPPVIGSSWHCGGVCWIKSNSVPRTNSSYTNYLSRLDAGLYERP